MHHAYLLLGRPEDAETHFATVLQEWGIEREHNPDLLVTRLETFGIDEARALSTYASRRALGERKAFLILPERLTVEAQNALLKTFEDPVPNTHFFLSMREDSLLLPTLLSRMQLVRLQRGAEESVEKAEHFASSTLTDRLKFSKTVAETEGDFHLASFLDNLLTYYKSIGSNVDMRKVYNMRRFANDRSVSPRLICEHLALVLS